MINEDLYFIGLQFTSYELFKRLAYFFDLKSSSNSVHLLHFVSGVCAGVTATAATFPLDVMRTFLVAQGEPKVPVIFLNFFTSVLIDM